MPNYPIGSVDNALRLLRLFGRQKTVRVAEAGRDIGVARSTAHRLMQMLQYHGFVSQDPDSKAYTAGPELIGMAVWLVGGLDLRTVARPIMADLVRELGETVHISVLRGSDIFFVETIETTKSLRVGSRTGMTLPAHATAAGKVLLAALDPGEVRRLLGQARLAALTGRTLTSRRDLEAHLVRVRELGYASNFGESEEEVRSVAVPVRDSGGNVRAALAISAPPSRLDEEAVAGVATVLRKGAERISAVLPA
ncbi:IclR family transcriptional regulator [Nonomuraea sp. M3C6]|uniref:IclR family transcriptional regulator n=1 Tax=Nonomuraea marmarensis TaxID=3351344 RepID=A0ABW7AL42_9ACTN